MSTTKNNQQLINFLVPEMADLSRTPSMSATPVATKTTKWSETFRVASAAGGTNDFLFVWWPYSAKPYILVMRWMTDVTPNRWVSQYLMTPDQDLSESPGFALVRPVGASLSIVSNTVSSGSIELSGVVEAISTIDMPDLTRLGMTKLAPFADNQKNSIESKSLEDGFVMLAPPTGEFNLRQPNKRPTTLTPSMAVSTLYRASEDRSLTTFFSAADTGFIAFGTTFTTGVDKIVFDSDNSGAPTATNWIGKMAAKGSIVLVTSGQAVDILVEVFAVTQQVIAGVTTDVVMNVANSTYESSAAPAYAVVAMPFDTPEFECLTPVERFFVRVNAVFTSGVVLFNTGVAEFKCINVKTEDYTPVNMAAVTGVNVGQIITLSGVNNYEVVPDQALAKNINVYMRPGDPFEGVWTAYAYSNDSMVKSIYTRPSYDEMRLQLLNIASSEYASVKYASDWDNFFNFLKPIGKALTQAAPIITGIIAPEFLPAVSGVSAALSPLFAADSRKRAADARYRTMNSSDEDNGDQFNFEGVTKGKLQVDVNMKFDYKQTSPIKTVVIDLSGGSKARADFMRGQAKRRREEKLTEKSATDAEDDQFGDADFGEASNNNKCETCHIEECANHILFRHKYEKCKCGRPKSRRMKMCSGCCDGCTENGYLLFTESFDLQLVIRPERPDGVFFTRVSDQLFLDVGLKSIWAKIEARARCLKNKLFPRGEAFIMISPCELEEFDDSEDDERSPGVDELDFTFTVVAEEVRRKAVENMSATAMMAGVMKANGPTAMLRALHSSDNDDGDQFGSFDMTKTTAEVLEEQPIHESANEIDFDAAKKTGVKFNNLFMGGNYFGAKSADARAYAKSGDLRDLHCTGRFVAVDKSQIGLQGVSGVIITCTLVPVSGCTYENAGVVNGVKIEVDFRLVTPEAGFAENLGQSTMVTIAMMRKQSLYFSVDPKIKDKYIGHSWNAAAYAASRGLSEGQLYTGSKTVPAGDLTHKLVYALKNRLKLIVMGVRVDEKAIAGMSKFAEEGVPSMGISPFTMAHYMSGIQPLAPPVGCMFTAQGEPVGSLAAAALMFQFAQNLTVATPVKPNAPKVKSDNDWHKDSEMSRQYLKYQMDGVAGPLVQAVLNKIDAWEREPTPSNPIVTNGEKLTAMRAALAKGDVNIPKEVASASKVFDKFASGGDKLKNFKATVDQFKHKTGKATVKKEQNVAKRQSEVDALKGLADFD